MSTLRHTNLDGPFESGASVDIFRVERVVATRPDVYTVVEGRGPEGRKACLTLLAPPLLGDKELRRSVLGLARLRAAIQHPHLLEFRGAVESGNRVYLVSAPAGPPTLAALLGERLPDLGDTLRLLGQVAGALQAAAKWGLTHRDLTPQAIVLQEDDDGVRALLGDFGIALSAAPGCDLLASGDGAAYRSPEELRGEAPGLESNVYSLACILVECLTGTTPYPYDRPLFTMHAHLVEPPPRVSKRRPDLPPALDAVVARGMAKDPRQRYRSPGQLIRAAGKALGAEVAIPVIYAPPEERKRARRVLANPRITRRVRSTTAWIGVALFASVVSGFATGGVDWSDDRKPLPAVTSPAPQDRPENVAYTQRVRRAVDRLRDRRVAARTRLRAARRPVGQAAAAVALAGAYRDARQALPRPTGSATGDPGLGEVLRDAERSYRRLAAAARSRNPHAWRIARRKALRREAALQRALRTVRFS
jgi:hypothetical protein